MVTKLSQNWTFTKQNGETRLVDLPHDAMLTEKRYASCRSGKQGGFFPGGFYVYQKEFALSRSDLDKDVFLFCEGIYQKATVLVNGKTVGTHASGFSEFTLDLNQVVVEGKNHLEIHVDNHLVPNCRWYTGSGIYRPISLLIQDKARVKNIEITTLSYDPAMIEVSGETPDPRVCKVHIYDGDLLVAEGPLGRFTLERAILWDEHHPHLYDCKVDDGYESQTVRFGIRKIEWGPKTGLLINGQPTLLRGGCIHSDNGVLGACSCEEAEYRRVKILKDNGFNALRMAHNPASRAILDACDALGMYVLDEAFDGWYIPKDYHDYSRVFYNEYQGDLKAMVMKDKNHPSVIMYSIGNELTEIGQRKGLALSYSMKDYIKGLDSTRPVTAGINVLLNVYARLGIGVYRDRGHYQPLPLPEKEHYKEKKTGSAFFNGMTNRLGSLLFSISKTAMAEKIVRDIAPSLDIVGLNYGSGRYDIDAKKHPERLMLGTETMVHELPYNWSRVKKYKTLIGDFVWSAWDYLGEACIGDWTYHSYKGLPLLAGQGMIDITGKPLAAMAFLQVVWGLRKTPFIGVRPLNHANEMPSKGAWQFTNAIDSWSWRGFEGTKSIVEVYSDAHAIRLELDGTKIRQKRLKDFKAIFRVRYYPGTLTAVALDGDGKEVSRSSLTSGNETVLLSVKLDRPKMKPDGQLCFAEIEFRDKKGVLQPAIERPVSIHLEGESIELKGFGSALCKTNETFLSDHHDSYRGRCLAVFQSKFQKGITKVTFSADHVQPVVLELEVM